MTVDNFIHPFLAPTGTHTYTMHTPHTSIHISKSKWFFKKNNWIYFHQASEARWQWSLVLIINSWATLGFMIKKNKKLNFMRSCQLFSMENRATQPDSLYSMPAFKCNSQISSPGGRRVTFARRPAGFKWNQAGFACRVCLFSAKRPKQKLKARFSSPLHWCTELCIACRDVCRVGVAEESLWKLRPT